MFRWTDGRTDGLTDWISLCRADLCECLGEFLSSHPGWAEEQDRVVLQDGLETQPCEVIRVEGQVQGGLNRANQQQVRVQQTVPHLDQLCHGHWLVVRGVE